MTGFETMSELAGLISSGQLSPLEAVDFSLRRVDERNPSLNAVISLHADEARQRAKEATEARSRGESWGPLHGIPTLIKDGFGQKPGWTSTFGGIRALAAIPDAGYCPFAERVEAAGAIILGKTNSPTMGFRGTCDNFSFGPTRNPFDMARNSGGSSGGSAAAVADGMVSFAEGTDGGGSIRIPAAWCGLVGFKPSWGRVPTRRRPDAFNTALFAAEGPLARSVGDAAVVTDIICGHDDQDPYSLVNKPDAAAGLGAGINGMRIAFSPDFGVFPVDPAVALTVKHALAGFRDAGAAVDEVNLLLPYGHREMSDAWCRLIWLLNLDTLESLRQRGVDVLRDARGELPPQCLEWAERAASLSMRDVQLDRIMRTRTFDAIQAVFDSYDLLVTPTLCAEPVLNSDDGNTVGPTQIGGVDIDPLIGWCMTHPINFTGHPAISIPAGLSDNALPVGLQIIGRRFDDKGVFAAASAFERARPWRAIYERCESRLVGNA
jgi:amidase